MPTPAASLMQKPDSWLTRNLGNLLTAILIVAAVTALIVVTLYIHKFPAELSHKNEVWGQFGDYVGGTLNPILSFLALIALLLSLWVQNLAMDTSRRQSAQQTRVASMSAQITAISELIVSLNKQIEQDNAYTAAGGYKHEDANRQRLDRREELLKRLDSIYEQLVMVEAVSTI